MLSAAAGRRRVVASLYAAARHSHCASAAAAAWPASALQQRRHATVAAAAPDEAELAELARAAAAAAKHLAEAKERAANAEGRAAVAAKAALKAAVAVSRVARAAEVEGARKVKAAQLQAAKAARETAKADREAARAAAKADREDSIAAAKADREAARAAANAAKAIKPKLRHTDGPGDIAATAVLNDLRASAAAEAVCLVTAGWVPGGDPAVPAAEITLHDACSGSSLRFPAGPKLQAAIAAADAPPARKASGAAKMAVEARQRVQEWLLGAPAQQALTDEPATQSVIALVVPFQRDATAELLASLVEGVFNGGGGALPTDGLGGDQRVLFPMASPRDAWTTLNSLYASHRGHLRRLISPTCLFDAYRKLFGIGFRSLTKDGDEALHWAQVAAEVLLAAQARFSGLPDKLPRGASRQAAAARMLVGRIAPPVRPFVVRISHEANKADSAASRINVSFYNPLTGANRQFKVASFNDTARMGELCRFLCRTNTITALFATADTRIGSLMSLRRALPKPTCPVVQHSAEELLRYALVRTDTTNAVAGRRVRPPVVSLDPAECSRPRDWWAHVGHHSGLSTTVLMRVIGAMVRDQRVGVALRNSVLMDMFKPQAKGSYNAAEVRGEEISVDEERGQMTLVAPGGRTVKLLLNRPPEPSRERAEFTTLRTAPARKVILQAALDSWNRSIYTAPERLRREAAAAEPLSRYLVLDLETTTRRRYKRLANPFLPENRVVLPGTLDFDGRLDIPAQYLGDRSELKLPNLDDYEVLVGHNIKFDLHYLWRDPELRAFLLRGGRIWDTMYAEYLLSGHLTRIGFGAGLEDVGAAYGGDSPKLDAVKAAWAAGKDTTEIPHATLALYLEGDLRNTEFIFKAQMARAKAQSQMMSITARMDAVLCTTEMEFNGLRINTDLAKKQSQALQAEAAVLKRSMEAAIPPEVPQELQHYFSWGSLKQLTAVFYGGAIPFPKFSPIRSLRYPGVLLFNGGEVAAPAELAYMAGNICANTMREFAHPNRRARGLRTSGLLSETYSDAAAETRFEPLFLAATADTATEAALRDPDPTGTHATMMAAASREAKERKLALKTASIDNRRIGVTGGEAVHHEAPVFPEAPVVPPSLSQQTIAAATLETIAVWSPFRNRALVAVVVPAVAPEDPHAAAVAATAAPTVSELDEPCGPGGAKVLVRRVAGPAAETVAAVVDFIAEVVACGRAAIQADLPAGADPVAADRKAVVLARGAAEALGPVLARIGLTPDTVEARCAAALAGKADGPLATWAAPPEGDGTRLVLGDCGPLMQHHWRYFPNAASAAAAELNHAVSWSPPGPSKKPAVDGVALSPHSAEAAASAAEMAMMDATAGDALKRVVHCGHLAMSAADATLRLFKQEKACAIPGSMPPNPAAGHKPLAPGATELDANFCIPALKGKPRLDAPFATNPRPAEVPRLRLLRHIGALVSQADCFARRLEAPPPTEVRVPGLLSLIEPPELHDAVKARFRSPETGALQMGDAALTYFAKRGCEVAETILELRGKEKLLSTYYDDKKGGMLALVHEHDSCIHHELQHNQTTTGRLASANPNCQNIPKEDKSHIRELFVSRFDDGVCIEADYSQLEVVTLCALSKDKNMTNDLLNKVDFHCKRVTLMHPEYSYEHVVQKAKKEKDPVFVKYRQAAKIFSFQRQYGAGVKMLSASTGLNPATVKKLIANEAEMYSGVDDFYEMVKLSCHQFEAGLQNNQVNKQGDTVYRGQFPALTGSRFVFAESTMPEIIIASQRARGEAVKTTNFSPTHIKNYPVQGFAGEIVQLMIGLLWRHFVAKDNYGGRALLTNTVHDCVWIDARREVAEEVARDVNDILSSARTALNERWPELQCIVDFPVDVVAGPNMGHMSNFNPK